MALTEANAAGIASISAKLQAAIAECDAAMSGNTPPGQLTNFVVNGQPVTPDTLARAFAVVQDGQTISVKGGTVFDDQCGQLFKNNVTITTDQGVARFRKKIIGGKAIIVLGASNTINSGYGTTIKNIEFESAAGAVNAAGVKLQGKNLTLQNCKFIACPDGILTDSALPNPADGNRYTLGGPGAVTVDGCLFQSCGAGGRGDGGQTHGMYIGYGLDAVLTITNSVFQYAGCVYPTGGGHLVKSRGYRTNIDGCTFIKGSASRALDQCNGGHVSITNSKFYQDASAGNWEFIDFDVSGGEPAYPDGSFFFAASNQVLDTSGHAQPILTIHTTQGTPPCNPKVTEAYGVAPAIAPQYPAQPPLAVIPWNADANALWASIPLRRWVEIGGTRADQLVPKLNPNYTISIAGDGGFASIFSTYNGAAFDAASGKFFICGCGGHLAQNNGQYEFDADRFTWRIAMQPSHFTNAQWTQSLNLYIAAGIAGGSHHLAWAIDTGYTPPGWTTDNATYTLAACAKELVWNPPGLIGPVLPVAEHTYGAQVFVPGVGVVVPMSHGGPVVYDPVAGTASHTANKVPISMRVGMGGPPKYDSFSYFDAAVGKVFLCTNVGYGYYNILPYDPVTDTAYADVGAQNPLLLWYGNPSHGTEIQGARKMLFWNSGFAAMFTVDFSTMQWTGGNPVAGTKPTVAAVKPLETPSVESYNASGYFGTDEIRMIAHAPQLGVIGVCHSGRTVAIDPATGAVSTVDTGGTSIPRNSFVKSGSGIWSGTWGRFRYYPARKALVLLSATDENVRVFRIA